MQYPQIKLGQDPNVHADAIAPLTAAAEHIQEFSMEDMEEAINTTIRLLGNADARISRLRREKIIGSINKSLILLVQDENSYAEAAPELFGSGFAKRQK